jgi:hypothetical protein
MPGILRTAAQANDPLHWHQLHRMVGTLKTFQRKGQTGLRHALEVFETEFSSASPVMLTEEVIHRKVVLLSFHR